MKLQILFLHLNGLLVNSHQHLLKFGMLEVLRYIILLFPALSKWNLSMKIGLIIRHISFLIITEASAFHGWKCDGY
jgi:hypothetical protein